MRYINFNSSQYIQTSAYLLHGGNILEIISHDLIWLGPLIACKLPQAFKGNLNSWNVAATVSDALLISYIRRINDFQPEEEKGTRRHTYFDTHRQNVHAIWHIEPIRFRFSQSCSVRIFLMKKFEIKTEAR